MSTDRSPQGPDRFRMGPTRASTLVVAGLAAAAVAWLLISGFYYDFAPDLPWLPVITLAGLAVLEGYAAVNTRSRIERRPGREPVNPLLVARFVVLAKASALAGAIFAGFYAGLTGWLFVERTNAAQERSPRRARRSDRVARARRRRALAGTLLPGAGAGGRRGPRAGPTARRRAGVSDPGFRHTPARRYRAWRPESDGRHGPPARGPDAATWEARVYGVRRRGSDSAAGDIVRRARRRTGARLRRPGARRARPGPHRGARALGVRAARRAGGGDLAALAGGRGRAARRLPEDAARRRGRARPAHPRPRA